MMNKRLHILLTAGALLALLASTPATAADQTDMGAGEVVDGIVRDINPDMTREKFRPAPVDRRGKLKLKERPHQAPIGKNAYAAPLSVRK